MMNRLYFNFLIVFAALAVAGCSRKQTPRQQPESVDTIPMLVMQVQKCSRLYTAEYKMHKIITHDDEIRMKGKFLNQDYDVALPMGSRKIAIPIDAMSKLNRVNAVIPWRRTFLAPTKSFAPIRCAACTEKPAEADEQKPPNNHIHEAIRPTEAAALTPRLPTIAESINCINTAESWASMAGILIINDNLSCCPDVMEPPPLSIPNNISLSLLMNQNLYGGTTLLSIRSRRISR